MLIKVDTLTVRCGF